MDGIRHSFIFFVFCGVIGFKAFVMGSKKEEWDGKKPNVYKIKYVRMKENSLHDSRVNTGGPRTRIDVYVVMKKEPVDPLKTCPFMMPPWAADADISSCHC